MSNEEMNQLIESIAENITEMTKLDVSFETIISNNWLTIDYHWKKAKTELENFDGFSDIEIERIINHCYLSKTLTDKYHTYLIGSTDENARYGFFSPAKDEFTLIVNYHLAKDLVDLRDTA